MTRSNASARAAGVRFESAVADYLHSHVDDRIERRRLDGRRDRGDLTGLKHMGQRVVVEIKNRTRWEPVVWLNEAELERGNDDAGVAVVVAKRHGKGDPAESVVLMTLRDFAALLTGSRPNFEEM